jgi:hypothetical protein
MSYVAIASQTLTGTATGVTFSSIPSIYRDLVLVVRPIGATNQFAGLQFNGDTGSNYNWIFMAGQATTTVSANNGSFQNYIVDDQGYDVIQTNGSTMLTYHILDYSQTDKQKTTLLRSGGASLRTVANASRWASTAAINSIRFYHISGNLAAGTNLQLYGVLA